MFWFSNCYINSLIRVCYSAVHRPAVDLMETVSAIHSSNLPSNGSKKCYTIWPSPRPPLALLLPRPKAGTHFAFPRRIAGWVDLDTAGNGAATACPIKAALHDERVWPAGVRCGWARTPVYCMTCAKQLSQCKLLMGVVFIINVSLTFSE